MLSQVEIFNYQSHRYSLFSFGSGVNSITGSSNSGKSAALRAINWVVNNKPDGDGAISHWAWNAKNKQIEPCSVKITLDNGTVIERIRDADRNCYIIDGKQLDALNRSVPPEVADALNFSETNLQKQFGAPFLLTDSAGEVGKFFNKIAHFDAIDKYQSTIESKKRKTKAELEMVRENLSRVEEDLKTFDWIPMAEKLLKKIEEAEKKNEETECVIDDLKESLDYWERHQKALEQTSILERAEELVTNCTQLQTSVGDLEQKISNISNMVDSYKENESLVDRYDFIEAADQIVLGISPALSFKQSYESDIKLLSESINSYETQNRLLNEYEFLPMAEKLVSKINLLDENTGELWGKQDALRGEISIVKNQNMSNNMVQQEIDDLQASLPDVCPTCNQKITEICNDVF